MKQFRRVISALLVTCIMISTVGYTAVTFACPKMTTTNASTCSMCKTAAKAQSKTKNCCKPIVEHKVVHTDGTRPHEAQSLQIAQAVLPQPMIVLANAADLFGPTTHRFDNNTPPLLPDASTARAMLSTFLI
jgi:hypothetical protein